MEISLLEDNSDRLVEVVRAGTRKLIEAIREQQRCRHKAMVCTAWLQPRSPPQCSRRLSVGRRLAMAARSVACVRRPPQQLPAEPRLPRRLAIEAGWCGAPLTRGH